MSSRIQTRKEFTLRVLMIFIVLFNAVIPTAALAMPPVSNELNPSQAKQKVNSLPAQTPVYYSPDGFLQSPSQISPEPDKGKPRTPKKDSIEFNIFAENGNILNNRTITIDVVINNHAETEIKNIVYYDKLERGLEYDSSTDKLVKYSFINDTVTYQIPVIQPGEAVTFSYKVKVNNKNFGKLSIHNAGIEYEFNGETRAQTASLGFADNNALLAPDSLIVIPDRSGDGWGTADRYSLYLGEEVLPQEAVVSITPTKILEKGPQLQFKLELIQTANASKDVGGALNEQNINLTKKSETVFKTPAYLEINLNGIADLYKIPAGQEPYVATYDEQSKVWVKVPIVATDPASNSVIVEAAHFSTWGAGLGNSLPQNGANVLLFDQPYTSLFTGASRYSIPIWAPQGRAGMSPDVSLSYSSATVDGVLGDVQAPWTGVGWNIDGIEIVRKITTNGNGYGYVNDFALTLNGVAYSLVQDNLHPARYYTDHDSFLYIERHNYAYGNVKAKDDSLPPNTSGEWWEVVSTDGTRYRLGWNNDSEQLALMYGYSCTTNGINCLTPNGAYASLGYAGIANNLVTLRWRVDRITDTHGNYMVYAYQEGQPSATSTIASFDRESYLDTISYTGYQNPLHISDALSPAYSIHFVYAGRSSIGDIPSTYNIWDNLDTKLLDKIEICYLGCSGAGVVRTYDFDYSLAAAPNANGTLTLTSLKTTGGGFTEGGQSVPAVDAPTIRFTYQNMDNRAVTAGMDRFTYPRLVSIDNGAGGLLNYTYETDGRGTNSWYNYRVKQVQVDSGLGPAALQSYSYSTPVYTNVGGTNLGELIGYATSTENQLNYANSNAIILSTSHTFGTSGLDTGRELKTEWMNGATIYKQATNTYVTDNSKAPFTGWNYRYLYQTANYINSGGGLIVSSRVVYVRDPATGNLLQQTDYLGSSILRKTYYEYVTNPNPSVYILDKVSRILLVNAANQILGDTRYHYDGKINAAPDIGDLTLTQRFTGLGNQTVDSVTNYDIYGNAVSTKAFPGYGAVNTQPGGVSYTTNVVYDSTLKTYPTQVTNALNQSSFTNYLFSIGLSYSTTDANGWVSTTTYDGLGRTLSVNAPGLDQPGMYYTYPQVNGSGRLTAPYRVEMQILDTQASQYRSVWGMYDGMGRMIQTQVYDADNAKTVVSDSYFNAQGLVYQQSLPYSVASAGGYYISPAGQQFTTTTFDDLGRTLTVAQPGGIITSTAYDGLTTTITDPNAHKITRTTDGLGRLVNVKEFSDAATLYATTFYAYDAGDRLTLVTDAKGKQSIIQYDWLGRKTGMQDPDMGVWTYAYNALGSLTQQIDARNQILAFTYDPLGRLLTKTGSGLNVSNAYGATQGSIGMRISMSDSVGTTTWSYDNFGRTVTENREIGGQTRVMTTQSDWLGRPISVAYPDAETLTYEYDALGRPKKLNSDQNNSLVQIAYTMLGQVATQTLGNGVVISNQYNSSNNRLQQRSAVKGQTPLMNFGYSYDNAGNITNISDVKLNEAHEYQYDFLNRLVSAKGYTSGNGSDIKYFQQYSYDQVGNIAQLNDWVTAIPNAYREPEPLAADLSRNQNTMGVPHFASLNQQSAYTPTTSPDFLFADGFESGDFTAWNWSDTDGGDLSVSSQASAFGTYGMQAVIDDTTGLKVYDDGPSGEKHFSARFYLDPNSINIPNNTQVEIFDAVQWTFCLYLGRYNNGYTLRACGINDGGAWMEGDAIPILDEWQVVELEWQAASAAGANNGFLKLYVNDVLVSELTSLDNDTKSINDISLGVDDIQTGVGGTLYFDAFESSKGSHIGPVSAATATPTATELPTETFTNIPTSTFTAPAASTSTPSQTVTSTITRTPTRTPIPTNTLPTATYTQTLTSTQTYTPTMTLTPSKTSTASPVYTPTRTPTPYTISPTPSKTSTSTNTPTPTPQLGNLLAYWNFEAATGTTVPDEASGDVTANNAALFNGPVIESNGANGKGIFFDGVNDYASITDQAEIKNNGSFTVSAWVNPTSIIANRTQYLVQKGAADKDYGLITISTQGTATPTASPSTINANGSIAFQVGDLTPNTLIGPLLPVDAWTLVTGVYDAAANQMRLYLNGELVAVQNVTGTVSMGVNPLTFSSSAAANVYAGRLDEVRFYNRALNNSEVQGLLTIFATPTPLATTTWTPTPSNPTSTATALAVDVQQWGTGNDGSLTIAANTTFNINIDKSNGRTCADGAAFNVTTLGATAAILDATPGACLAPSDEVLLIELSGLSDTDYNAGSFEYLRVASVNGTTVEFVSQKTKWYGMGWRSDSGIGVGSGQVRVMLMRVPNYSSLAINGTLTATGWDYSKYGVIPFRVNGILSGGGNISANGLGFHGGGDGNAPPASTYYGESPTGHVANAGGGKASDSGWQCWSLAGGGGGYGSIGGNQGGRNTVGGITYGSVPLSTVFFGSGGGAGGFSNDTNSPCGDGHNGGGIILISAQTINFDGTVFTSGANGTGAGGGGAGGTVRVEANSVTKMNINAQGNGNGGVGRVAVYYQNNANGLVSSPSAYMALLGQAPTPTPSATAINLALGNSFGNGKDGDFTVPTNVTFNAAINGSNGRSCGDMVTYVVTQLTEISATLSTSPTTACLVAGDEILLIHLNGGGSNKGKYEFLTVGGITGNSVYFKVPKVYFYGANEGSDASLGSVYIVRVPNYNNVVVNGVLKSSLLVFRVKGTLSGTGTISSDGLGFGPASGYGAGGAGGTTSQGAQSGGGGGYGTAGADGATTRGGKGGVAYGVLKLDLLFWGSGGGPAGDGDSGGPGGGIIYIIGNTFNFPGTITSNGGRNWMGWRGRWWFHSFGGEYT
jgi:YD repeat-containing protein